MAIPTVFQPVLKQDFTLNPIQVHKRFVIGSASFADSGSGYKSLQAVFTPYPIELGTNRIYPTNSIDGSYKHILWKQIDSQYYRFPYDPCATLEHSNERYTYKLLNISASIITIPQQYFGEGIKPGSIKIRNTTYGLMVQDDGNGNLFETTISTASYVDRKNITFDFSAAPLNTMVIDEYVQDAIYSNIATLPTGYYRCRSTHDAQARIFIKNAKQNSYPKPGCVFPINTDAYGLIDDADYLNPHGDFSISLVVANPWGSVGVPATQSILNKNSVIFKETVGFANSANANNQFVNKYVRTGSYYNERTSIYPYRFEMRGGLDLHVMRSNGIDTIEFATGEEFDDGSYRTFTLVKTGSNLQLWIDHNLYFTEVDNLGWCGNKHAVVIGNTDTNSTDTSGLIYCSIKFFDRALTPTEIPILHGSRQIDNIVGNAFYKTGTLVLSPRIGSNYTTNFINPVFNSKWSLEYQSIHTIYEYEILCRVKKSVGNLTLNPSARKYPGSDLLMDDFTGSLDTQYELSPYITGIGLYNDKFELMAVAKLGQAIKTRSDVDLNFLIKFDA